MASAPPDSFVARLVTTSSKDVLSGRGKDETDWNNDEYRVKFVWK